MKMTYLDTNCVLERDERKKKLFVYLPTVKKSLLLLRRLNMQKLISGKRTFGVSQRFPLKQRNGLKQIDFTKTCRQICVLRRHFFDKSYPVKLIHLRQNYQEKLCSIFNQLVYSRYNVNSRVFKRCESTRQFARRYFSLPKRILICRMFYMVLSRYVSAYRYVHTLSTTLTNTTYTPAHTQYLIFLF